MVAKMIRWPWPPMVPRKFEVRLVVQAIEGVELDQTAVDVPAGSRWLAAEVRWKGPRTTALRLHRRKVRRNCTMAEEVGDGKTAVEWNEEFESAVRLTAQKENAFNPWEIEFAVFSGVKQVFKNKALIIGTASMNLAEYASRAGEELRLNLPLLGSNVNSDSPPMLHVILKLVELRTCSESSEAVQRPVVEIPLSSPPVDVSSEKEDVNFVESGIRKVKILADSVSTRKSKKSFQEDEGSDGRYSAGSEDTDYTYMFDSDSPDDNPVDEIEYGKADYSIRKSFSYGALSSANYVDGAYQLDTDFYGEYEDCVYHSHRRSDSGYSHVEETVSSEQSVLRMSKRSILPWRKRKHNYKSPKTKGEPLLKKAYGEEGGDDIDHDRRQLTSSDESFSGAVHKASDHSSVSDFGDDNFAVGCWESKELLSRDGKMKLFTEVFFASIDQRSERAAGQSACTALVAIIADWFKSNHDMMPIKSQFDALIREGSLEWRNLCENRTYMEQFPDKHFDLETVLQAKIRPLSVVPGKSFIGFFNPEGCEDSNGFEFLHGAMSFDSIWDEIAWEGTDCLYIVSWNDHFFILKVERDAYYIIDTLGERLYEGCGQAYILKFDDGTKISRVSNRKEKKAVKAKASGLGGGEEEESNKHEISAEVMVSRGKESCKEYIKSFLAAIPIRELQADIKKGIMASTPLHHRLQIEFHYTEAAKDIINFASISPLPLWGSTLTSGSLLAV